MNPFDEASSAILGDFIPVSISGHLNSPTSIQFTQTDVASPIHPDLADSQMDRLPHALPGNYSPQKPQRHHNLPRTSDASRAVNTRDQTNGSQGFYSLAESARARHAAAPVHERRYGPETSEQVIYSKSARDNLMASYEHDNEGESTRGRHPPAHMDEGHRHGDRNRHTREVDAPKSSRMHSSRSRSPFKRSRSPDKSQPIPRSRTADPELSEYRRKARPTDIDINTGRQYGCVSKKAVMVESVSQYQPQHGTEIPPNTPPTPLRRVPRMMSPSMSESEEGESSSYYSEEEFGQAAYVSPLRVRKDIGSDDNVAQRSHNTWGKSPSPGHATDRYPRSPQRDGRHAVQKTVTTGDLRQREPVENARNYSPLSDYLWGREPVKRKEMVGKHGWLERTDSPEKEPDSEKKDAMRQQKKGGFLKNLKKLAKDITSDITASASRNKIRERDPHVSRLTVSMDPREQSLLYCELEFILTTALDNYINSQFKAGRLDADKYKKIVDAWQQRGRPKVIGFRYDLETQLDLILLHNEDFRFYGKRAGVVAAVNGVLDMARVDARAMRIRTFCQPDTVVAKQLLDAQALFNLIGCSEKQQIQLAEVIQFFKVILEREQDNRRQEDYDQLDEDEQEWHCSRGMGTDLQPKKSHSSKNSASVLG